MNLAAGLVAHLSTYLQRDYRRFLSAHLQYLQGLCRLSIELVNNSVNQFLASLMITTQMLSETAFNQSLDLLIQQAQSTTPTKFSDFFFLLGSINHGNVYMSTYGTNFEYISRWYFQGTYLSTRDITYDDECSCGIYSNCTSQASFIDIANYSQIVPLKGLKIGCTPSESFHLSTLECFYDRSCIDLIEKYANYENISNSTKSPILLATQTSRFSMNTTVFELLNNLFVEKWSTKLNYSTYYQQCSLSLCSHTYSQQFNPLYTVTLLLSLHGGLTIILKLICPKIIQILNKINNHRKKRMNIIQPNSSIEITTIDNINTNVHNTTCNIDSISMNRTFP